MPDTSIEPAGLAPPDQGPTFGFKSRERLEDRTTRKPMSLWDRIKMLVLLVGLFFFFVLAETGDNPILPFGEAFDQQLARQVVAGRPWPASRSSARSTT